MRERDREKELGKEMKGGKKKEEEYVWRRRTGIAFWLQFSRDSIDNTKAVCVNNELTNCYCMNIAESVAVGRICSPNYYLKGHGVTV